LEALLLWLCIQHTDNNWYNWVTQCHCFDVVCVDSPVIIMLCRYIDTVASYIQPVVQQYESLKITSAIEVGTMKITDNFRYKWKPSCAYHKIDTFCSKQRWMGHKGRPCYVHEECNVFTVVHLLGWIGIEQQKNLACNFSHCWVTWVWRH